jgi:hypothetical protein
MVVAVLTPDIGQRMSMFLRVGMGQALLHKHQGEEDNGTPLFGRFIRLPPQVGPAQRLFDVNIVHRAGPALWIDAEDWRGRPRQVRAQTILRGFVPRGPFAAEDTDGQRQRVASPLEGAHQGSTLSPVCSGPLHARIPLVSKRLGPLGALRGVQLPMGRDRTHHLPALTAAACAQALGRLPTVKEPVDRDTRRHALLERRQPRLGQRGLLAQVAPRLRGPRSMETPPGLLAAGEPPILRIGPCAQGAADLPMHGALGGVGCRLALALGGSLVVGDGFEMAGALVFVAS